MPADDEDEGGIEVLHDEKTLQVKLVHLQWAVLVWAALVCMLPAFMRKIVRGVIPDTFLA